MSDDQPGVDRQGASNAAPGNSSSNSTTSNSGSSSSQTSNAGNTAKATAQPSHSQETRKPQIGDSRPAPTPAAKSGADGNGSGGQKKSGGGNRRRRRGGGGGSGQGSNNGAQDNQQNRSGNNGGSNRGGNNGNQDGDGQKKRRRRGGRGRGGGGGGQGNQSQPVTALTGDAVELDEETLALRKGRERNGRPAGRYMMCVSVREEATQIAVLEGRTLIEHYVSRPADDVSQIHGNIYMGKVQNVLPGMEAAFIDITTPKNAVLYRSDVVAKGSDNRSTKIEQLLKSKQNILCQVTKNPIAHKGARLTQEVSLPGRFVVLVPNSDTYGISKRLPDKERKRLRKILDRVKPKGAGIIVRTAAENVTEDEIVNDVRRLANQWEQIEKLANASSGPSMLYREPEMAVRVIREEFNKEYRGIMIDDRALYEDVKGYVESITPALADRVQYYDRDAEPLSLFERHHVAEQLRKAVDTKVWLPSGGSLIIEGTEALTVIDVNTGKNVGSSSLEETVYRNNLEAAREVARQLRLRDVGGIIVIDFVDMEIKKNREEVVRVFREALAQDKTRTQVFDISELGLVEMTRKRIGEGLVESLSKTCETCEGPGHILDESLLDI